MDGDKDGQEPRKKVRSPSFPFVGLREALDRARAFYEAEQRNSARIETAASHWGYSPKSSGGKQTIAALRSFGLLDGDSLVKLSGRALRILLDERGGDSEERRRLVQQAALLPPIHARLWERYGAELPSPQTLKLSLILDEGFNESSVDHFLTEYRETLEYARLLAGPAREETAAERTERTASPSPPPPREARPSVAIEPVVFPLLDGNAVELRIRRAISAEEAEDVRVVFELWLRKIVLR